MLVSASARTHRHDSYAATHRMSMEMIDTNQQTMWAAKKVTISGGREKCSTSSNTSPSVLPGTAWDCFEDRLDVAVLQHPQAWKSLVVLNIFIRQIFPFKTNVIVVFVGVGIANVG